MEAMRAVTTAYNGTQYYPPFPYVNQVLVFHSEIHTHTSFPVPNFNYLQPDPPPPFTSSYDLQHNTSMQNIKIPQQQQHLGRHETDLGIFKAERYFKETQDHNKGGETGTATTMNRSSSSSHCPNFDTAVCDSDLYCSVSSMDGNGDYTNNGGNSNVCRTRLSTSRATWNGQSMLLSNPPRGKNIAACGKRKWWCFGLMKCPCIGKKSVQVSEPKISFSQPRIIPHHDEVAKEVVHVKAPLQRCNSPEHHNPRHVKKSDSGKLSPRNHSANRVPSREIDEKAQKKEVVHHDSDRYSSKSKSCGEEEAFTFPVLNSSRGNENGDKQEPKSRNKPVSARTQQRRLRGQQVKSREPVPQQRKPPPEEEPRPAEVPEVLHNYSSPETTPYWATLAATRDYNGTCQSYTFPARPAPRLATTEDDLASDASSDLFEIDSLSMHPHSQLYPMHYDRMNSVAEDTSGYETRRLSFSRRSVDEVSATCSFAAAEW